MALVPARAGSKGVPNKNLADLGGRPLIEWTIQAVRRSETKIRLVVTTDSRAIATLARALGAEVVMRPKSLAGDESPTEPALLHALTDVGASASDTVLMLQPTSPFRRRGTIDRAIDEYMTEECDSVVGVVPESPFLWTGPAERPTPHYTLEARRRRQDLNTGDLVYREPGSLYVCSVAGLKSSGNRLHGRIRLFEMAVVEGHDIDTPQDLEVAQGICIREWESM